LLQAEIALRRQEKRLPRSAVRCHPAASCRRTTSSTGVDGPVRMSELFGDKDTLYLYNFMYRPGEKGLALEGPCPSCTSIIDAVDGAARHLTQAVAFAVVAKSRSSASARGADLGWRFAPFLSSANNTFKRDYLAEDENEMHGRSRPCSQRDGDQALSGAPS